MPSRTPRRPSIGFSSCSRFTASSSLCSLVSRLAALVVQRDLDRQVGVVGQELVQRRVDQPDGHRQPVHRLEDADEVLALHRQQLGERLLLLLGRLGQDQVLDQRLAARRGTCARCGTARCPGRRSAGPGPRRQGCRRWPAPRAGASASACSMIRPTAATSSSPARRLVALEVPDHQRVHHRHLAGEHLAGGAVDRDRRRPRRSRRRPVVRIRPACDVDRQRVGAAHAGAAHAAGHHRGVRGLAAAAGEDARAPRPSRAGRRGWSPGGPGSPSSPRSAHSTAVSESKTALPTAAPGEAFMPFAISSRSASTSNRGNISCASWAPVTRRDAPRPWSIRPWSTSWQAIRKAASAVRLPTRVCSIQSLPALDGELDVAQVAVVAPRASP